MPDTPPPAQPTEQQEVGAGHRKVNLIWERTQAAIALVVVFSTMGVASIMVFMGKMDQLPTIFSTAFGMVVGFYFGRTNHSLTGGSGPKIPGVTRDGS